METPREADKKLNPVKRFLSSPFLLLVVLLLVVDGAVVYLQSLDKQNQFQQNPRLLAIRSAIEGARKPDVIVLGDSLIYSALFFADANAGLVADKKQHFTYLEARYLSRLLKEKFGMDVDVLNLSMPAANPTDAYLILSELEERGKLPKLVIYGASPRAMCDNLVPSAGAIGGKLALNVAPSGQAASGGRGVVARAVRDISNIDVVANKIREYGQLGDTPEPAKVRDFYTGAIWSYFHDRGKVRACVEDVALNALGRKPRKDSVAIAQVCAPEVSGPSKRQAKAPSGIAFQVAPESFQRDLNNYRVRYNPPNFSKLEKQSAKLDKIAELLGRNNSHFLIVSMPLSAENKNLISDELMAAYQSKLSQLDTSNSVTLLDSVTVLDLLSTADFEKAAFLDSAHLNGYGATRLDHKLASVMRRSWFD
jgi:hypothetical protein